MINFRIENRVHEHLRSLHHLLRFRIRASRHMSNRYIVSYGPDREEIGGIPEELQEVLHSGIERSKVADHRFELLRSELDLNRGRSV